MDNYKEKYKKALERAKKLYEQGTITESLGYVFPELTESEDERIRKGLIENFKCFCGDYPETTKWGKDDNLLVKDIIAWLEEQNPAWSEKDKNLLNRLIGVLDGTNEEDYHEGWEETFLPWLKSIKERMQSQPKQCKHLENFDNGENYGIDGLYY